MNYEIRTTKYERRGFTLIELVVAIGLLMIVILFAGTIFKSGIGSYRIAMAQAEIMQKLRTITQQLNSDFKGLRRDAPMFIWFQLDPSDPNYRLDQIMFFADGDFQSTRLYSGAPKIPWPTGTPVVSNVARIQYGHARVYSPTAGRFVDPCEQQFKVAIDPFFNINHRTLARRQHLYIANPEPPQPQFAHFPEVAAGNLLVINPNLNDSFEHDTNSLSEWQAAVSASIPVRPECIDNCNTIITSCFGDDLYFSNHRPQIKLTDADTLHLLMTEGVGSFSVQWSYSYTNVSTGQTFIYWWPSDDPDGNPATPLDSDFGAMVNAYAVLDFGFYFNAATPTGWFSPDKATGSYYYLTNPASKPTYPQALKFTFTLYDSRGVFKEGQTFTHIVYLGD
jgi:prepilin-type N-terminal cleavage/methylation domain-containing protein